MASIESLKASPPVPMKKTLVLVNNFIISTSRFLNHLHTLAEEKRRKVSDDISRVETALILLESRLSRIEGMEDKTLPPPTMAVVYKAAAAGQTVSADGVVAAPAPAPAPAPAAAAPALPPVAASPSEAVAPPPPSAAPAPAAAPVPAETAAPAPPPAPVPSIREHPDYAKFFKLVSMNVPPERLKMEMRSRGLKPELLDTPDAPITAAGDGYTADVPALPAPSAAAPVAAPPAPATVAAVPAPPPPPPPPLPAVAAPAPAPAAGGMTVRDDPTFSPFFKMQRMGIPLPAVQQKMMLAGLDPALLETPDALSPYAGALVATE